MTEQAQFIVTLLDELVVSWARELSSVEIRHDHDKLALLMVAAEVLARDGVKPSELTLRVYDEVFLRNVWGKDT